MSLPSLKSAYPVAFRSPWAPSRHRRYVRVDPGAPPQPDGPGCLGEARALSGRPGAHAPSCPEIRVAAAVGMTLGPIQYLPGRRHLAGRRHDAEFAAAPAPRRTADRRRCGPGHRRRRRTPAHAPHAPRPLRYAMHIRTQFPYETTHEDVWIPLPDGTTAVRPDLAADHRRARARPPRIPPVPPERLDRAPRRAAPPLVRRATATPPYASTSAATATARACRATSTTRPELADGVDVVNWLAEQPWCTGKVGMFGISWGGFNSLQIAALAPRAAEGDRHGLLDRRPLRQRRALHGRRRPRHRHARLGGAPCWPSPPARRTRRTSATTLAADMWRERLEARRPVPAHLAGAPDPRRLLAARQRLRGLRGDRRGRARGRRLARPVPRHRAAARGAPARRPRTRADRPLVAPVPGPRPAAGPGDRLPPGDPALVGPLSRTTDTGVMDEPLLRAWISDSGTRPPRRTTSCPAAGSATPPGPRPYVHR